VVLVWSSNPEVSYRTVEPGIGAIPLYMNYEPFYFAVYSSPALEERFNKHNIGRASSNKEQLIHNTCHKTYW
jgi:hypothetical protein